jgi:putative spermidine/putrescine transport system permease protein
LSTLPPNIRTVEQDWLKFVLQQYVIPGVTYQVNDTWNLKWHPAHNDKFIFTPWLSLPSNDYLLVLLGASFFYAVAESVGYISAIGQTEVSFSAYRKVLDPDSEFWTSLTFSLWVASPLQSFRRSSLALAIWLSARNRNMDILALNWNLAFPHLVWSVALLLFLSQSGLLARWAASLGLITTPEQFPILLRDSYGIGVILSYIGKEVPFLTVIILSVLRSQSLAMMSSGKSRQAMAEITLVTIPQVLPALLAGDLLVFGFIFSSYEVPALLGVGYPRALPVLALRFFLNSDLRARSEGMVISLIITLIVVIVAVVSLRVGESQE